MSEKLNLDALFLKDAERKRAKKGQQQELTLRDYLGLLEKDPLIAQNSASRLLEICLAEGVEEIPEAERWLGVEKRFTLFSKKLYGVEKPVQEMISFFKAGAARLSTGKQILLLVGPTSSGKSTIVSILKHALEDYRTRQVFAIKNCPMHQEPLLLLPRYLRPEIEKKLGVKIKGDLCPPCRHILDEYTDKETGVVKWLDIPVETFTFSIQGTRGIGSFEPADEKTSDVTDLVGKENIGITSNPEKGYEHWQAYTLTGELQKANRGICEGREMIKTHPKLLYVFISVAEEQEIKIQGSSFPHISVDEVVIGHTNLAEYKKFAPNQAFEALHSRTYLIAVPYALKIKDEVAIYHKLIREESDFSNLTRCHIAPGTFEISAIFALLTRLVDSQTGIDNLTKLKIYNGDKALTDLNKDQEKVPADIRQLIEEGQTSPDLSKREGMFGVDPRDVLAALNTAIVEQEAVGCLTPLTAIRSLRKVFDHRMGYTPEEVERFKLLLSSGEKGSVMNEYKDFIIRIVSKAFLRAYDDLARKLVDDYIKEAQFYRDQKRKFVRGQTLEIPRDHTGKPKEPNVKLLRSIEEHIPIHESEADAFRGEILEFKAAMSNFGYDTYPPLARAADKKLLADSRSMLTSVLDPNLPQGQEENKRITDLFTALTEPPSKKEEDKHCAICAKEAVERAREFITE